MLSKTALISRPTSYGCSTQRAAVKVQGASNGSATTTSSVVARPALPPAIGKKELVSRLLAAKEASGKSFTQIAADVGLTNIYTAQLFHHQQQLQPNTAAALQKAVPALTAEDINDMMRAPLRSFDPNNLQEPALYRLYEAITHGGESIKAIINEEFGDGIMSAIGFYATIDKVVGKEGEPRVVITFNGKFLPYVEQKVEDNVAQRVQ